MHKNNYLFKHVGQTLSALTMMLLFLWCGVTTASAQSGSGTIDDPFVLTADGGTYNMDTYKFYGVFTAPSEGELVINETYSFYTDDTFTTQVESMQPKFNGDYANKEYSYTVEGGQTYYVYAFSWSKSITMKFRTEAEPLVLNSVSPDPETAPVFNAGLGILNLVFNQPVGISGCELTAGSNKENVVANVRDMYVSVDSKNYLAAYYDKGTLNEGDDIIFKFTGVKRASDNALYNGDGVVQVAYKAGPKPLMLVSSKGTPDSETPVNTFKSYYTQNDPDGMVMLTYSGNVSEVKKVTLEYGTTDGSGDDDAPNTYYVEEITPKILDNTVVIDFRGKLRRHQDMLPNYDTTFPTITLKIAGILDENGNSAFSPGLGTVGTYNFTYNYNEINYTSVPDWAVDGNAIGNDTKSVELWLEETGGNATFTGVEFAYTDGGEAKTAVVNVNDVTIEADPDDPAARIITIPVPNVSMDADSKVTVSLTGVETPDGVAHDFTTELACSGKSVADFRITSAMLHAADGDVEMVNGVLGTIATKTTATITTTKEVGYMTWEVTEPELGSLKQSYGTPNASTFDITFRGAAINCLAGHTYTFTLKAWHNEAESRSSAANPTVGTATFTFTGTGSAYVYSDVMLLNHIADPFPIVNNDQKTYTLSFDAPANVKKAVANLGSGMSDDCELVANDDKTEWTLTFPASVLSYDAFDINVFAEDMEGHAIYKNSDNVEKMGSEDNTWISIPFSCEFNRPDFTVEPASETEVEKIDVVTFSYTGGINISYSGDKISIYKDRQMVKEIAMSELQRPEGYDGTEKLCFVLDEPLTAEGTYTIDVPSGFFVLGEQFESYASKTTTIYYTIKAATTAELKAIPEDGSTLEQIDRITFNYEPGIAVNWDGSNDDVIEIFNKTTRQTVATFTKDDVKFPDDFFDVSNVYVELDEPITEGGRYSVIVPAGFFALGEMGDALNEEYVAAYEIPIKKEPIQITVNPAGGNVTEIPERIILSLDNRELANYSYIVTPTLTDDKGNNYALHFDLDWDLPWNNVLIVLDGGAITTPGTYTLTLPAECVYGDDEEDVLNEDIVVTYYVSTTDGIDNIVANAGGKVNVYTTNGACVLRNADATAVKSLKKGLYIINDKKVVIKK